MSKKRSKPRKTATPSPVLYSAFALAGAGAVLLLSLLAGLSLYQSAAAIARDTYAVAAQHNRLRQRDAELPRQMVLGYLSDLPQGSAEDQALFFGARYVLAPRLLVRDEQLGRSNWVLGNFVLQMDPAAFAAAHRLRVAKLYGPGVVLFRILPGERPELLFAGLALLLVGGAHAAAHLASPSLSWQLSTSLGRLCAQLWPALLLLISMLLGRVEDRTAGPPR